MGCDAQLAAGDYLEGNVRGDFAGKFCPGTSCLEWDMSGEMSVCNFFRGNVRREMPGP